LRDAVAAMAAGRRDLVTAGYHMTRSRPACGIAPSRPRNAARHACRLGILSFQKAFLRSGRQRALGMPKGMIGDFAGGLHYGMIRAFHTVCAFSPKLSHSEMGSYALTHSHSEKCHLRESGAGEASLWRRLMGELQILTGDSAPHNSPSGCPDHVFIRKGHPNRH
jgi:hypothetical protein